MIDITAIGEILIDFTPAGADDRGIPLFSQNPGGGPVNMLAMYAKLGGKAAFIGKIGNDRFGDFLRDTLKRAGIDTSGVVRSGTVNTTLAFVHLDRSGDRSFSFYRNPGADITLETAEIDSGLIEAAGNFHVSGVSLTGEPSRSAVCHALDIAVAHGKTVSYDPNYRPQLWGDVPGAEVSEVLNPSFPHSLDHARASTVAISLRSSIKRELVRPLAKVDILKVSDEEAALMTGEPEIQNGAAALAKAGPAIVLVTLGPKGAFFLCRDGTGLLPAYDVPTVDTTGAGDAFLGAVLFKLRGKRRADVRSVTRDELADIVRFANAAGSLATTKPGGIPAMPSPEAVAQLCAPRSR
ncbi:MAG: carbohydrate kinase [Spirochaetaceae bacterium]|jgi:fructokinase|nr:carbohydrate kinase [Spirochaetaceae bacterium]